MALLSPSPPSFLRVVLPKVRRDENNGTAQTPQREIFFFSFPASNERATFFSHLPQKQRAPISPVSNTPNTNLTNFAQ